MNAAEQDILDIDETEPRGCRVTYYLPRLSVEDLAELSIECVHQFRQHAGFFWRWLHAAVARELARRLAESNDEPPTEVEVLRIPADWTNDEIARALMTTTAWTYSTRNPEIGCLYDALNTSLVAFAGARL